jgi:hypothetical protein
VPVVPFLALTARTFSFSSFRQDGTGLSLVSFSTSKRALRGNSINREGDDLSVRLGVNSPQREQRGNVLGYSCPQP